MTEAQLAAAVMARPEEFIRAAVTQHPQSAYDVLKAKYPGTEFPILMKGLPEISGWRSRIAEFLIKKANETRSPGQYAITLLQQIQQNPNRR